MGSKKQTGCRDTDIKLTSNSTHDSRLNSDTWNINSAQVCDNSKKVKNMICL